MTTDKTPATLATAKHGGCVQLGDAVRALPAEWRERAEELSVDDAIGLTHQLKLKDCADELEAALASMPTFPAMGVTDAMVHAFEDAYCKNWEAQRHAPEGTKELGTFFATRAGLEAALSAQPSPSDMGNPISTSPGGQGDVRALFDEWLKGSGYNRDKFSSGRYIGDGVQIAWEAVQALAARLPVGEHPMEMRICELRHVSLKPNRPYVFTVDQNCAKCRADAAYALGHTDSKPALAVGMEQNFQARVAEWMGQCFLPSLYSNMTERGDRLLEEVLELLQAHGYDKARIPTLVDYVFGRPVGEPAQEVGGVMVTLAGYCWVAGLDMHAAGDAELARINQPDVMAKIRDKQEAKNALHFDTPLPGKAATSPPAQAVDRGAVREALQAAEGLATICASVDGYSREELAASGRAMRQQFADALAKVDSQAVGNG